MTDYKIGILLATYEGGKYITEQVNSIINQTYSNWELYIRDDCSTDETFGVILEFAKADKRIKIVENNSVRLGACQNFSELMSHAEVVDYVMFCDQDDIWLPKKIEMSLKAIRNLEMQFGSDMNYMVFGTYSLIDEKGSLLPLSIPDYSTKPNLRFLLSQNYVYGCTMLINKNLFNHCFPIPATAENHDYWITLTAIVNNAHFAYLNEPMILYRQHSNNVSGSYSNAFFLNRIKRIFSKSEVKSIESRLHMFNSLYERFRNNMNEQHRKLINGYLENVSLGGWKALTFCIKNEIGRRGKIQTLLFYFNLLRKS